jgi:hypothetical protein
MSLDPKWYSSVFGLLVALSYATTAVGFAVFWVAFRAAWANAPASGQRLHDLGNLLLAFVMLWAYLAFMQLVTVWIADLPHEIRWYLPRLDTSWKWLGFAVIAFHLILPMPVLLSRAATHTPWSLALAAAAVLVGQILYALWLIFPTLRRSGFDFGWADAAIFLGVTGLWLGALLWRGQRTNEGTRPPRATTEAYQHG